MAQYKRRIGPWLLWRAGPATGGDARYWAARADDPSRAVTLAPVPRRQGATASARPVRAHTRFRAWKEDLRDHP